MTMDEDLFFYFPVFVARVVDPNSVKVWLNHPGDTTNGYNLRTIQVDISATPSSGRHWKDVQVDDYFNDERKGVNSIGFSALGPVFPHVYAAGGLYLRRGYWLDDNAQDLFNALSPNENGDEPVPPAALDRLSKLVKSRQWRHYYEHTALIRRQGSRVRRYHGFHASLLPQTTSPSSLAQVDSPQLYGVAHAGASGAKRVRKYIVVPSTDIGAPATEALGAVMTAAAGLGHHNYATRLALALDLDADADADPDPGAALFLAQDLAKNESLDVPKRPSGLSEGAMAAFAAMLREKMRAQAQSQMSASPVDTITYTGKKIDLSPRGKSLSVFGHDSSYGEVRTIKDKLVDNYLELTSRDLSQALRDSSNTAASSPHIFENLDLIGHTRSNDDVLKISELPLTPVIVGYFFTPTVIRQIVEMGFKRVRLLGCRTACHPHGRDAVAALSRLLREGDAEVEVLATRGDIFAAHFDVNDGFTEARLLVDEKIMHRGGPNDAPPFEDPFFCQKTEAPAPDSPTLATIGSLPCVDHVLSDSPITVWKNPEGNFAAFRDSIDWQNPDVDDPLDFAQYLVIAVHGQSVRGFEIIAGSAPRIRINYPDRWYSYSITDIDGANAALGVTINTSPINRQ